MPISFDDNLIAALKDQSTYKALATTDGQNVPHIVEQRLIHLDETGNLVHLELLQSSTANRNLIRSLWFDRPVAVSVSDHAGRSWQITGTPWKVHITGPLFRRYYDQLRAKFGDVDLAAVWVIPPSQVLEQTHAVRQAQDETAHPYHRHLDRLTRNPAISPSASA